MKDKTLILIIGVLVGAIITTACFLIIKPDFETSDNTNNFTDMPRRNDFDRNNMPGEGNIDIYAEMPPVPPNMEEPPAPINE